MPPTPHDMSCCLAFALKQSSQCAHWEEKLGVYMKQVCLCVNFKLGDGYMEVHYTIFSNLL